MRLALKHQIILAPTAVLCLMTLLLFFLQYTYWDLSFKRQKAKDLKTAFIAIADADMAVQRMLSVVSFLNQSEQPAPEYLEQLTALYEQLLISIDRVQESDQVDAAVLNQLRQSVTKLNPEYGKPEDFNSTLILLQPVISKQLNRVIKKRERLSRKYSEDTESLVAETTFITIIVLAFAILVGILLSLTFARHILRRIKVLSDSAARVTAGEFSPPPAPERVRDELDGLAVSINRMTEQLIRVVAAEKVLEGAEEERRRIAMDIHDQTLADLSAVKRGLEPLLGNPSSSEAAKSIETDLQRAMSNLRVVMDNLHPQTLDILGLPAALESLLEKSCEMPGSPAYHFLADEVTNALKLPKLTQVTVYRIVAEAINNALRHARASLLEVGMTLRGKTLVIAVEDNGIGFDHNKQQLPSRSGGRGLHNIQERARAIGAKASWRTSRFSSGTRFELVLPITDE
jgi:two-component system sensor histidine kinase UhpB